MGRWKSDGSSDGDVKKALSVTGGIILAFIAVIMIFAFANNSKATNKESSVENRWEALFKSDDSNEIDFDDSTENDNGSDAGKSIIDSITENFRNRFGTDDSMDENESKNSNSVKQEDATKDEDSAENEQDEEAKGEELAKNEQDESEQTDEEDDDSTTVMIYSDTIEDFNSVLDLDSYAYFDSGVADFAFAYPKELFSHFSSNESVYSEYGDVEKEYYFSGSDSSKLVYRLIRRTDGRSLEEETNYIHDSEQRRLSDTEDIIFKTVEDHGKVIITGIDDIGEKYAVYDLIKIEPDFILQMRASFPQFEDADDKAHKYYYAECLYRMCGFSDSENEPRTFEEYMKENSFE